MRTLRIRCIDNHFLFLYIKDSEVTLSAYSFNHFWSSNSGSLPLAPNAVFVDTFVSAKTIEVEQNGSDILTVRWNAAETETFSVHLHDAPGNSIFRRLFDGIAAGIEETTRLSLANRELKSLADSAVEKYSDLAFATAEREQLLFSRFIAILERSKAQQNDERMEQSMPILEPSNDVKAADPLSSKSLVGEQLMKTLVHRVSPKTTCKRPSIPTSETLKDALDLEEIT